MRTKEETKEELYKRISDLERVLNCLTEELRDADDNFVIGRYKMNAYGNFVGEYKTDKYIKVINATKTIPTWVFELRDLILEGYHPCMGCNE